MRTFVVTPPDPVVTWEEADAHLKLDGDTSQKTEVEAMIASATGHIDGPDGWLGRAIGPQLLEARIDSYDAPGSICLLYPPVIEVESVKWLDASRAEQTADPDSYELFGHIIDFNGTAPWTGGYVGREAVRIRYRAGYETLPPPIRAAILLMVGDLYRNRDTVAVGNNVGAVPMSTTVQNLLAPFQRWN